MKFLLNDSKETIFECFHDIRDVLAGTLPAAPEDLWMDAGKYSYGFGNGAMDNINGLGESILVNGTIYTKSTSSEPEKYYRLFSGKKFITSWMFSIPTGSKPTAILTNEDEKEPTAHSILDIYSIIFDKLKKPFLVSGIINFKKMDGAAIAKSPIDNKNIFENEHIYYPNTINEANIPAAMIGVAVNIKEIKDETLSKSMENVVYFDPLSSVDTTLTTHEHILVLNKKIDRIEKVTMNDAIDVNHLFTSSVTNSFYLNIYAIDHIELKS